MLPPHPRIPKGAVRTQAGRLSTGDILFLETAASGDPVRSLILEVVGSNFKVMNRLNPDPYVIRLPASKPVWALKIRPWPPKEDIRDNPREPVQSWEDPWQPPRPEDFRAYWRWDPKDRRAGTDFHSVEEKEWSRLHQWWERKKEKRKKVPPKPRVRIDGKVAGWYKLLGVRAGVSFKELKKAYKKAAFKYHPDRCKDSNAEEMFKRVSEAFHGLSRLIEKKAQR